MRGAGFRLTAAMFVVITLMSACGVRGLDISQDKRLEFTSPVDRAKITLPLTVSWTTKDFKITGADGGSSADAGYFGVFIDRSPQPPGETQGWIVRDDEQCRSTPGCPNVDYLASFNIFSTTDERFVIDRVAQPSSQARRRREFHEITVVLLNGRGERIGESGFTRQFEVDRDVAS